MTSQLQYFLAREQQAELAWRAERVRQTRNGEPSEGAPRGSRLRALGAGLRRRRLQQRELPLPPGGVERAAVPAGCLEVE
jgi:hypothetical protein